MIVKCGTSNHRQMFYKPNVIPFCSILIIILLLIYPTTIHFDFFHRVEEVNVDVKNDSFITAINHVIVQILKDGIIYIGCIGITNENDMPQMIEDAVEETRGLGGVCLIVSEETEFRYVQTVLRASQKAGIYKVYLITKKRATPLTYFIEQNIRQNSHR